MRHATLSLRSLWICSCRAKLTNYSLVDSVKCFRLPFTLENARTLESLRVFGHELRNDKCLIMVKKTHNYPTAVWVQALWLWSPAVPMIAHKYVLQSVFLIATFLLFGSLSWTSPIIRALQGGIELWYVKPRVSSRVCRKCCRYAWKMVKFLSLLCCDLQRTCLYVIRYTLSFIRYTLYVIVYIVLYVIYRVSQKLGHHLFFVYIWEDIFDRNTKYIILNVS